MAVGIASCCALPGLLKLQAVCDANLERCQWKEMCKIRHPEHREEREAWLVRMSSDEWHAFQRGSYILSASSIDIFVLQVCVYL